MSRVCEYCGKRSVAGRRIARRGKAKKEGGVGKKITGITVRKFRPNIQKIQVELPQGGTTRVKICTHCLRSGVAQKPIRSVKKA